MAKERIKGVYFKECNTKCDAVFDLTREEAISRMAKALHFRSTEISDMEKSWEKLDKSWQDSFCKYAEAALNALLEHFGGVNEMKEVNNER